jgi:hypothetical protein
MGVLEDEQAGDQPCRQRRLTGPRFTGRGEALLEETPVDLLRQPYQRVAHIDDLLQRRPEQVLLPLVARSGRSRGRAAGPVTPLHAGESHPTPEFPDIELG